MGVTMCTQAGEVERNSIAANGVQYRKKAEYPQKAKKG
jgi:hypothetical protein